MLRFLITNLLAFLVALFFALIAVGVSQMGHAAPTQADLERARSSTTEVLRQAAGAQHHSQSAQSARDKSRQALQRTDSTIKSLKESGKATPPQITGELLEKARRDVSELLSNVRNNPDLLNDALAPPGRYGAGGLSPFIMVSFSMPEESVQGLFREAARIGATVVLRGLVNNSMQATAEQMIELMGVDPQASEEEIKSQVESVSQPSFAIDPTLFQRFKVDKVPTFVVPLEEPEPCSDEKCPTPPHVKVAGDVSLSYALRTIKSRTTNQGMQQRLTIWLDMLEDKP